MLNGLCLVVPSDSRWTHDDNRQIPTNCFAMSLSDCAIGRTGAPSTNAITTAIRVIIIFVISFP